MASKYFEKLLTPRGSWGEFQQLILKRYCDRHRLRTRELKEALEGYYYEDTYEETDLSKEIFSMLGIYDGKTTRTRRTRRSVLGELEDEHQRFVKRLKSEKTRNEYRRIVRTKARDSLVEKLAFLEHFIDSGERWMTVECRGCGSDLLTDQLKAVCPEPDCNKTTVIVS